MERKNIVTAHGNPLTLIGTPIKNGNPAPEFTALDKDMKPVNLKDLSGKPLIISAVPSLDTPVCELQTIRFNQEVEKINVTLVTISMDLPFAQKRFCESHNLPGALTLSDFRDRSFSHNFGVYIKELGLIARSVFLIDINGTITYHQICSDISLHPEYDAILSEVRKIADKP